MPRRSRLSGRPSTTSRKRSSLDGAGAAGLRSLIESLPPDKLEQVLTHPSWTADRLSSYERLEFLGDSVLELAVARTLFERFTDFSEGQMAKIRSHVVSRASCATVAVELGLDARLAARAASFAPPEDVDHLVRSRNVLAAMLEAALAAVFLEHGFEAVEPAVVAAFMPHIEHALANHVDHKTELQEVLARLRRTVVYAVLDTEGPAHERLFTCAAVIDGEQLGVGSGRSKKDAEQLAAQGALARLEAGGLLGPAA